MIVGWFSGGVSSAVAINLALKDISEIVYIDIDDQHKDTIRFLKDCEKWYNKTIIILQSKYKSVENACLAFGYLNGVGGAKCTQVLKKRVRKQYEKENNITGYIWGFDYGKKEINRSERIKETLPEYNHYFPLIENRITKQNAHAILLKAGIKRPVMYEKGYPNNNCIGCLKGGKGYWNKIRTDFPDVFKSRSLLERKIGASCINGCFLDQLEKNRGHNLKIVLPQCGIFCKEPKE